MTQDKHDPARIAAIIKGLSPAQRRTLLRIDDRVYTRSEIHHLTFEALHKLGIASDIRAAGIDSSIGPTSASPSAQRWRAIMGDGERAAIVAWLRSGEAQQGAWWMLRRARKEAGQRCPEIDPYFTPKLIADAIERGDHLRNAPMGEGVVDGR